MVFGKTSLIRAIMSQEKGINVNPSLDIAYFRQNLDNLNPDKTIIENVAENSIQEQTVIRNILGNLNIRNDEIYKKVVDISGGEKVKVSLAKIILSNSNMLILDEPTNFLDIEGIEALEEMLKAYTGTVLMVSHDRKFIDDIADNIIIIENGDIKQYEGNYEKYLESQNQKPNATNQIKSSNDKLLLQFKRAKLESEIASTKDEKRKQELIEELQKMMN